MGGLLEPEMNASGLLSNSGAPAHRGVIPKGSDLLVAELGVESPTLLGRADEVTKTIRFHGPLVAEAVFSTLMGLF